MNCVPGMKNGFCGRNAGKEATSPKGAELTRQKAAKDEISKLENEYQDNVTPATSIPNETPETVKLIATNSSAANFRTQEDSDHGPNNVIQPSSSKESYVAEFQTASNGKTDGESLIAKNDSDKSRDIQASSSSDAKKISGGIFASWGQTMNYFVEVATCAPKTKANSDFSRSVKTVPIGAPSKTLKSNSMILNNNNSSSSSLAATVTATDFDAEKSASESAKEDFTNRKFEGWKWSGDYGIDSHDNTEQIGLEEMSEQAYSEQDSDSQSDHIDTELGNLSQGQTLSKGENHHVIIKQAFNVTSAAMMTKMGFPDPNSQLSAGDVFDAIDTFKKTNNVLHHHNIDQIQLQPENLRANMKIGGHQSKSSSRDGKRQTEAENDVNDDMTNNNQIPSSLNRSVKSLNKNLNMKKPQGSLKRKHTSDDEDDIFDVDDIEPLVSKRARIGSTSQHGTFTGSQDVYHVKEKVTDSMEVNPDLDPDYAGDFYPDGLENDLIMKTPPTDSTSSSIKLNNLKNNSKPRLPLFHERNEGLSQVPINGAMLMELKEIKSKTPIGSMSKNSENIMNKSQGLVFAFDTNISPFLLKRLSGNGAGLSILDQCIDFVVFMITFSFFTLVSSLPDNVSTRLIRIFRKRYLKVVFNVLILLGGLLAVHSTMMHAAVELQAKGGMLISKNSLNTRGDLNQKSVKLATESSQFDHSPIDEMIQTYSSVFGGADVNTHPIFKRNTNEIRISSSNKIVSKAVSYDTVMPLMEVFLKGVSTGLETISSIRTAKNVNDILITLGFFKPASVSIPDSVYDLIVEPLKAVGIEKAFPGFPVLTSGDAGTVLFDNENEPLRDLSKVKSSTARSLELSTTQKKNLFHHQKNFLKRSKISFATAADQKFKIDDHMKVSLNSKQSESTVTKTKVQVSTAHRNLSRPKGLINVQTLKSQVPKTMEKRNFDSMHTSNQNFRGSKVSTEKIPRGHTTSFLNNKLKVKTRRFTNGLAANVNKISGSNSSPGPNSKNTWVRGIKLVVEKSMGFWSMFLK